MLPQPNVAGQLCSADDHGLVTLRRGFGPGIGTRRAWCSCSGIVGVRLPSSSFVGMMVALAAEQMRLKKMLLCISDGGYLLPMSFV